MTDGKWKWPNEIRFEGLEWTELDAAEAERRIAARAPMAQNIPIRTELGTEIRRAFLKNAERAADYRQIELRALAQLLKEKKR